MKKLLGDCIFSSSSDSIVFWFCWLAKFGCQPMVLDSDRLVPLFLLQRIFEKDYKASLMCLIIAFIIANVILDLLPISSGLVIGAGVLACVGIGYLFPDKEGNNTLRKSLQTTSAFVF